MSQTQDNLNPFKRATRSQVKLRMALLGPSGSGKTWTALSVADALGRVAVIDTEHGSASKYGDHFTFDVLELARFHPNDYIDAIQAAGDSGYDVLIIDSLSHAWNGAGGVLEMVDDAAKRSETSNSFVAWRDVTPIHNQLVEAILAAPLHVIATMRTKTEYVLEKDSRGKTVPRKVGTAAIQRDGMEYEFDLVAEMDIDNTLRVTKSRISDLANVVIKKPGTGLGDQIKNWLNTGEPLHWAKNGGGQHFRERMKALNVSSATVLVKLEPGRALARLSDTTLTEEEALARLEKLAAEASK